VLERAEAPRASTRADGIVRSVRHTLRRDLRGGARRERHGAQN
jgi:hypothetical protein